MVYGHTKQKLATQRAKSILLASSKTTSQVVLSNEFSHLLSSLKSV